jgi:flagellar basal body-associated protein FliL
MKRKPLFIVLTVALFIIAIVSIILFVPNKPVQPKQETEETEEAEAEKPAKKINGSRVVTSDAEVVTEPQKTENNG